MVTELRRSIAGFDQIVKKNDGLQGDWKEECKRIAQKNGGLSQADKETSRTVIGLLRNMSYCDRIIKKHAGL